MFDIKPVSIQPKISYADIRYAFIWLIVGAVLALIYLVMEGRL